MMVSIAGVYTPSKVPNECPDCCLRFIARNILSLRSARRYLETMRAASAIQPPAKMHIAQNTAALA